MADDRIVTIGGIHGIVTNVDADAGKVTIRVDETNNVKMDMAIGSVANIVTDDEDEK